MISAVCQGLLSCRRHIGKREDPGDEVAWPISSSFRRSQGLSTKWHDGNFDALGAGDTTDTGKLAVTRGNGQKRLSYRVEMVTPLLHLGNNGCLL